MAESKTIINAHELDTKLGNFPISASGGLLWLRIQI